ncbi:Aste57867_8960 [Aphanomyces stellatus]|uniref:Aste57867_8960 protein n=1 Tax=Aphanomyces stellatus TaxID=120398 RepID=A0A485KLZ2_9STRA|nr:hypothetical protein As57867_008925 [Aphanomyces stellatus]VFT85844.1 Aste57867_8960 [Aphanomyces stellatus]
MPVSFDALKTFTLHTPARQVSMDLAFQPPHVSENPSLYKSNTVMGLYLQYFVLGLLYQSFSSFTEPLFTNYFHMVPPQSNLIGAFTTIAWSCKVVFGILSDCFPIWGYRRKSWMILGWSCCAILLVVLATMRHGRPYVPPNTPQPSNSTNSGNPQDHGLLVSTLCGIITVFYVLAIVAADAMVVELSEAEPDPTRGRLLAYMYMARNIGTGVAQALVALLLNAKVYGGDYTWGVSVNAYFALLATHVVLLVPLITCLLHEATHPTINCPQYLGEFWDIVQVRPMWQTMLFAFGFNLFTSVLSVVATPVVKYDWAHVSPQHNRWMNVAGAVSSCAGLWFVSHVARDWGWRSVLALLVVVQVVLGATVDFVTIYNVVRNEWMTLIMGVVCAAPQGAVDFLPCLAFLELTTDGKEGITYGMLTTMANIAYMFTPFLGTAIVSQFDVPDGDDSATARHRVATPLCIGYALYVSACAFLVLLPNQKYHIRFMRAYGGQQPVMAMLTLLLCFGCVLATVVTSLFKVFPSTMCQSDGWGTTC